MSEAKLAQRRLVPDFSSWWLTQRRRMASGDSFINSSMRSPSPKRFVRPGQCSSVIWLNKPIYNNNNKIWYKKGNSFVTTIKTYSNNLPEEPKDQMGFAFSQIVCVNVDNVTANRLSRVQGQCQILVLGVECQVLLVDGSFIDRIRAWMIDHFAVQKKIEKKGIKNGIEIYFGWFLP